LAGGLISAGWSVVIDGRDAKVLSRAENALRAGLAKGASLVALPGDVTQPDHRARLADAARALGGLDLLVNNAGILGPSPLPVLVELSPEDLRLIIEANVIAPLALVQELAGLLRAAPCGRVIMVSSDAAVGAYPGWGGYGAAKAAVDRLGAVLAVEEPQLRVWVVDPGDLRTEMHQAAFPGEDISDRPEPAAVVPGFLALIGSELPSGRYLGRDLLVEEQR
jgi:NAD(P)-dependent dehydrogenase (short-subunit alcohol dehydrogenase family)